MGLGRRYAAPMSSTLGTMKKLRQVKQLFPVTLSVASSAWVIVFVPASMKVLEPFGETLPILVLIAQRYYLCMLVFPLASLVIALMNMNSLQWNRVNWFLAALSVGIALITYMAIHMACSHCFEEVV